MADDDKIIAALWLDLETTGLDFKKDQILEVGAILTEPQFPWAPLGGAHRSFHRLVMPSGGLNLMTLDPFVVDMHSRSGLFADLKADGQRLPQVYDDFYGWIRDSVGLATSYDVAPSTLRLAGSGVAHFDIHMVERYMSEVRRMLDYATIDVGQMRRFAKSCGIELEKPDGPQSGKEKAHRAMADVRDHLAEAQAYGAQLRGAFGLDDLEAV